MPLFALINHVHFWLQAFLSWLFVNSSDLCKKDLPIIFGLPVVSVAVDMMYWVCAWDCVSGYFRMETWPVDCKVSTVFTHVNSYYVHMCGYVWCQPFCLEYIQLPIRCTCLPVHVSLCMSPCACLPVHVSLWTWNSCILFSVERKPIVQQPDVTPREQSKYSHLRAKGLLCGIHYISVCSLARKCRHDLASIVVMCLPSLFHIHTLFSYVLYCTIVPNHVLCTRPQSCWRVKCVQNRNVEFTDHFIYLDTWDGGSKPCTSFLHFWSHTCNATNNEKKYVTVASLSACGSQDFTLRITPAKVSQISQYTWYLLVYCPLHSAPMLNGCVNM